MRFATCTGMRVHLLLGALLAGVSLSLHAQQGSIAGKVSDATTGQPLEAARVVLAGPNRVETTGQDGQYTIRGVAPGRYQLKVLRLGYQPTADTVQVAAGEIVAHNFAMTLSPVQLDELVTTATGQQSRLEIGNSIATIPGGANSRRGTDHGIHQSAQWKSRRRSGAQEQRRHRYRHQDQDSRAPTACHCRMNRSTTWTASGSMLEPNGYAYNIGGQSTSRINDLNPDDIENIEIVKGPSAATLYGIQAANGVVLITTKRGVAGKPRWNAFVEQGAVTDQNTYRTNYFGRSADPNFDPATGDASGCTLLLKPRATACRAGSTPTIR